MVAKDSILKMLQGRGQVKTRDVVESLDVSRQYASRLLNKLVSEGQAIKIASTRNAHYVSPQFASKHSGTLLHKFVKTFKRAGLEEHKVLDDIEKKLVVISKLKENIRSIFTYAFSEMLNNAIEHSKSNKVKIEVTLHKKMLSFVVDDYGIGVYKNIMKKRKLKSEVEAIQDLLKGKTTTMPRSHSGEGIFFTSKTADTFTLESFGHQMVVDDKVDDIFIQNPKISKKGTRVHFEINTSSKKSLNKIFRKYTNLSDKSDYGFDKTEIKIKLYTMGGVHVSRSQARRVLSGLEKFKVIVFDFDKVSAIGQAFADEIFRVFQNKYPKIKISATNTNKAVQFMINRVEK
jgi:anti-sigma regulatory factor (Ser/Thr protein kinase)